MQPIPPWASALGRVPSGLFVITAAHDSQETGILASWVQQCSFDPPQLTFAVAQGRPLVEWLKPGAAVGIHILAEAAKPLIARFGRGFAPNEPAFNGLNVERLPGKPPRLLDALAWIEAEVRQFHPAGDHWLFIAQVYDGRLQHEGRPTVHLRRDARKY